MAGTWSHCGAQQAADAKFCTVCGTCRQHGVKQCTTCSGQWVHCGREYTAQDRFCGVCGRCRSHGRQSCRECWPDGL